MEVFDQLAGRCRGEHRANPPRAAVGVRVSTLRPAGTSVLRPAYGAGTAVLRPAYGACTAVLKSGYGAGTSVLRTGYGAGTSVLRPGYGTVVPTTKVLAVHRVGRPVERRAESDHLVVDLTPPGGPAGSRIFDLVERTP